MRTKEDLSNYETWSNKNSVSCDYFSLVYVPQSQDTPLVRSVVELIPKADYLTNAEKPHDTEYFNNGYWCEEANLITKINYNNDGYFDFSKSILDIGAFIGVYSFLTRFSYAYCFEPNFESYSLLNVNMLHFGKKFKSYNVLLSDKKETISYDGFNTEPKFSGKYHGDNYEHHSDSFEEEKSQEYETHTIDEYNCENLGLIKVDVEGMEEKVLRGAIGTIIRNNYPPILFELFPIGHYNMTEEKYNSLINFLQELGYEIKWNWGDGQTHLAIHKNNENNE